jgi:hypothetical protein
MRLAIDARHCSPVWSTIQAIPLHPTVSAAVKTVAGWR